MKNRLITVLLLFAMLLSTPVGCGPEEETTTAADDNTEVPSTNTDLLKLADNGESDPSGIENIKTETSGDVLTVKTDAASAFTT